MKIEILQYLRAKILRIYSLKNVGTRKNCWSGGVLCRALLYLIITIKNNKEYSKVIPICDQYWAKKNLSQLCRSSYTSSYKSFQSIFLLQSKAYWIYCGFRCDHVVPYREYSVALEIQTGNQFPKNKENVESYEWRQIL
jgi:hypothetical protein